MGLSAVENGHHNQHTDHHVRRQDEPGRRCNGEAVGAQATAEGLCGGAYLGCDPSLIELDRANQVV